MKSFAPPQKETKHIHASAADLLHAVLQKKITIGANTEAGTEGVLRKKVVFEMSQNSQETPVPKENL